jgi:diacylglycerol kinase (ATP)
MLVNPTSAKGRGLRAADTAERRFVDAGVEVQRLMGRDAADALDVAHRAIADGAEALVVCGGDGIVHLGVQAVATTDVPLGIIPAGTGNDVARYLGIDRSDAGRAADVVIAGHQRRIDLGCATPERYDSQDEPSAPRASSRWFVTVASAGFGSVVNDRANAMTRPVGRSRYDIAMLIELARFSAQRFRIDYDDLTVETQAMLVAVGNGPSFGGGMKVTADASLHDGLFDVLFLPPMARLHFITLFPRVYTGSHLTRPEIDLRRSRRVRISGTPGTVYADGELLGELPMRFETVPDALTVFATAAHTTV